MDAILDVSPYFEGQLRFLCGDQLFRSKSGCWNLLSEDWHIINSDQAYEICEEVSKSYDISLTDAAVERMGELFDCSEKNTESFKPPFEGFAFKKFQRRAINVLGDSDNCMLQTSCGTGKSLMSLFLACQRFDAGKGSRIVVFCPVALVSDWVENFEQASNLTVGTPPIHASAAKRAEWYENDLDVWVLNYERLRTSDYEPIKDNLKRNRPIFIYDEVTKVKNRKSQLHKELSKLRKAVRASSQIALTATPIVRGPEDFYNEFRIIQPEIFGNVTDFERLFTFCNGEKDRYGNYIGYQNLSSMHLMAGTRIFSATKTRPEIACEFPQKHEQLIEYSLDKHMQDLYDEVHEYGASLDPEVRLGSLFALTKQRICNMPEVLLEPHSYAGAYGRQMMKIDEICRKYQKHIMDRKQNAKLQLVLQKVDEVLSGGDKLIIFGQHTRNCLYPLVDSLHRYSPLVYTGDTDQQEKERIKALFKNSDAHNLLVMSDAGQVGLNFQECAYLMHYQTPISHAAYEQRSDRCHRISSAFDHITVMRFMAKGTIEEAIEETMQGRKKMAGDMGLGGEEYEEFGSLTPDDLDFLCGF